MKACEILLLAFFLLFCQTAFAQTVNSSITIKINRGNYIVSGIVGSDLIKNEVIEKIKTQFGNNVYFSKISVRPDAKPFFAGWQTEFDKSLSKIKTWKSGVVIFSNVRRLTDTDFPLLPEEIVSAKFLLHDGQTVSLNDYKNKVIVLFFLESWCSPCIRQAQDLKEFYPSISARNIEIIGISAENSPDEKSRFRELFKRNEYQFKFGWTDDEAFQRFDKIYRPNLIPQVFVILNSKLRGVFIGGGWLVTEKLKETILKTLDENNL